MTNEQLVARIQAGENVAENMNQLYNQVRRFIRAMAWRYRESGEVEDLEQEGYLALYPAIDGYTPSQGVKFLTYAEHWIRRYMQRYLQTNGCCLRLPIHCLERVKQYRKFCNAFALKHGCEPSDWQIAAYMDLTLEQVKGIKENACMANLGSLDSPVTGEDGGEDGILGDFVSSGESLEEDVIERQSSEELRSVLWECVDSLPGKQPAVVRLRFQEGKTLQEVGEVIGTNAEGARIWQQKALRELRKPSRADRLRPFLPETDRIYGEALRGNGVERFNRTWTSSTERVAMHLVGDKWN